MNRLTERDEFGNADIIGVESTALYAELDGLNDVNRVTAALNKLAAYEDAEEQGRLVRLPCAVGDTVYLTNWRKNQTDVIVGDVQDVSWRGAKYSKGQQWCLTIKGGLHFEMDIGKTVFLTRAEAEAALAGEDVRT